MEFINRRKVRTRDAAWVLARGDEGLDDNLVQTGSRGVLHDALLDYVGPCARSSILRAVVGSDVLLLLWHLRLPSGNAVCRSLPCALCGAVGSPSAPGRGIRSGRVCRPGIGARDL